MLYLPEKELKCVRILLVMLPCQKVADASDLVSIKLVNSARELRFNLVNNDWRLRHRFQQENQKLCGQFLKLEL